MLKRIFDFLFFYFAIPLGVLMVIVGGIFILTAADSLERASQGKKILTSAIISIVIFFSSWVIVNTVLSFLVTGGPPGGGAVSIFTSPWNQVDCGVGGGALCP
jgi:Na+/H+ antiporter NhaD/arsenite permease-like protein